MQLTVLGLNHRTAPVEIRERFNFSNDRVASILRRLRNYDNIPEAMLLSTCNRTELYMVIENPHEAIPFIKSLLKHLAGEHWILMTLVDSCGFQTLPLTTSLSMTRRWLVRNISSEVALMLVRVSNAVSEPSTEHTLA